MTPEQTAQLAGIIVAVGAVLPLLTSVVQQARWSTRTRTVVGVAMSVLAGLVTYVTQFGLNLSNVPALVATVVGVILAAGTAYKTVWQPSGVAAAIEGGTSPKPATADPDAIEGDDEDEPEVSVLDADDVPEDVPPPDLAEPVGFDDGARPA